MGYTAKQINKMSIEEIEQLAQILNQTELNKWVGDGYSGEGFIEIIKNRET